MVVCDRWVAVKVLEVLMTIACLVCKRVTDDESVRLSLYLQKISREWSLLRNITWDSIGASFGDAIYGGYVIITIALLFAKMFREIPRGRRILEGILLGFGALFFIILGGLELAALDSLPDGLIDNAAVLGTLSLVTAALFLIDLGGPRHINTSKHCQTDVERINYPVLPNVNAEKRETKPERNETNSGSLKPKFFPEKFKKSDKKSDKKLDKKDLIVKDNELPIVEFKPGNSGGRLIRGTDEVDKFISSQQHRTMSDINNENVSDTKFDSLEITKYGSVRNGAHDREMFEKITPITRESKQLSSDDIDEKFKKYEEEMEKNVAYLKLLEERNMLKYQLEKKYKDEELERRAAQLYPRDYYDGKRSEEKKKYFFSSPSYDKTDKNWERFEAENLPRFPVREDYLPELQTPTITKLNEKPPNKGYGIYDNLTLYNINSKQADTQTDTLKSKTSTLKSKPLTLQQIAEYFGLPQKGKSNKREAAAQVEQDELPTGSNLLPMPPIREDENINYNGGPSSPIDPGYVQYTARRWDDRLNKTTSTRTPKHSPTGN